MKNRAKRTAGANKQNKTIALEKKCKGKRDSMCTTGKGEEERKKEKSECEWRKKTACSNWLIQQVV